MAENLSFIDGEYIFREGETAEYAYIVASGIIEITKINAFFGSSPEKVLTWKLSHSSKSFPKLERLLNSGFV